MWDSPALSHKDRNSLGWDSLPSPGHPKPLRHARLPACQGESRRHSLAPREGSSHRCTLTCWLPSLGASPRSWNGIDVSM